MRTQAVCAALEAHELVDLARIMTGGRLAANETLVEEGDPRRRVFSLTGGMLRLSTMLPDGRRQIAGFLMPGDFLGLADDDVHSQTAEAVVPSTLCAFGVAQMDALVETHPRLRDRLHAMTRQALRQAWENQMILGRLAPVEKLAAFLLVMARRTTAGGGDGARLVLPMTRTDIADYLGLTIETVSRSFTKLKGLGLIALPNPQTVLIRERRSLEAVAGISLPA